MRGGARGGKSGQEAATAKADLGEAQPRESVDDRGGGGGAAIFRGLGQRREKDVGDALGGPGGGGRVVVLCEREEARDGLADDVLKRRKEEEVEVEFFFSPCRRLIDKSVGRSFSFSRSISPSPIVHTISPHSRGSSTY